MPERSTGPGWVALFLFAATTRAAVLGFGYFANVNLPPLPWLDIGDTRGGNSFVMTFYRWDAQFYRDISNNGYNFIPGQYCTAAFMPLLPTLMAIAKRFGSDPHIAGLVIPNIAFVIGLAFFGKAVSLTVKDVAATWRACALLCAYPTAFFFSCPYNESLAFVGVSFAWWAWLIQRPGASAAGIFFAAFARLTSLAFPAALGLEWIVTKARRKPTRSFASILLIGLAGLLSVGIFCFYMYQNVGDPLAHMKAHEAWNRMPPAIQNIGRTLLYLFYYHPRVGQWHETVMRVSSLLLFTGLGLRAWSKRGIFAGALILIPILQALLTGTPMSLERIVLASFPAFLDLGEILKRPAYFWIVLILFVLLQCILLNGYVHFQFVG